jgi:2-C-methyl-D-erythritol 4-phosphate cytidylyltransferase
VIACAAVDGAAIPVVPTGILTRRDGRRVPGRQVAVQTPQAFDARLLLDAYSRAERDGFRGTDTAACVERYAAARVSGVRSSPANLKVTFPEDLALAGELLSRSRR